MEILSDVTLALNFNCSTFLVVVLECPSTCMRRHVLYARVSMGERKIMGIASDFLVMMNFLLHINYYMCTHMYNHQLTCKYVFIVSTYWRISYN